MNIQKRYVINVADISPTALQEIQEDCDYCYNDDSYVYYVSLPSHIKKYIAKQSGLSKEELEDLLVLISW